MGKNIFLLFDLIFPWLIVSSFHIAPLGSSFVNCLYQAHCLSLCNLAVFNSLFLWSKSSANPFLSQGWGLRLMFQSSFTLNPMRGRSPITCFPHLLSSSSVSFLDQAPNYLPTNDSPWPYSSPITQVLLYGISHPADLLLRKTSTMAAPCIQRYKISQIGTECLCGVSPSPPTLSLTFYPVRTFSLLEHASHFLRPLLLSFLQW